MKGVGSPDLFKAVFVFTIVDGELVRDRGSSRTRNAMTMPRCLEHLGQFREACRGGQLLPSIYKWRDRPIPAVVFPVVRDPTPICLLACQSLVEPAGRAASRSFEMFD